MNSRFAPENPARNQPCPCGSGKKFKRCCGAPGRGQAPLAKGRFDQVLHHFQQGNLAAADNLARQLLHEQPDVPELIEIVAVIAVQRGQPEEALARFAHQIRIQPDNALAHSNLCSVLHDLHRDEEAFVHGTRAIALDPKLADAWNNLGNIYKTGNRLDKALEHYEQALALSPGDPRVLVNAGLVSQLLGDLDTAEQRYRRTLQHFPDFLPAWNNLATVLQQQQRPEEADDAFRHALALAPGNPEGLTNYGNFLLQRGETDAAQEHFHKALQAEPDYPGAHVSLASLYERTGDNVAKQRHYDRVLLRDPENSTVHCNLGYRMYELGEQKEAIGHFVRALKTNPNSPKALAGLGKVELQMDNTVRAETYIKQALALAPWDVDTHIANALLMEKQQQPEQAEAEWRYAIEHQPAQTDGYIGLANFHTSQERYDQARTVFRDAEGHQCANVALYHAWSQMEEKVNQLDAAEQLAAKATAIDPDYPGRHILQAKLARRRKRYAEALEALQQVDKDSIENLYTRASYLFELGTVQDKLGNYAAAISAYDEANEAKNRYAGRVYQPDADRNRFSRWKDFYSAEHWQQLTRNPLPEAPDSPQPIFIVGFPRSGTSLLEQILGSHPDIAPAGELSFLNNLTMGRASKITGSDDRYPDVLLDATGALDQAMLLAMRDYYLDNVRSLGVTDAQSRWVTDKMPHNSVHVGLIALLFPRSPIIHIARHPLNSCLSAYFSNFATQARYTSSLESTALHYRDVMGMLQHYRQIGVPFLRIRYEDLVADQEAVTRKVLDYVGAPWNDACLQYHKSDRVVKTASYEQVTQKIYTSSLYRYRNYRDAVQRIVPILADTMEQFGYTVE
jgi:Tfp pilus assembly protein PilF